MTLSTAALGSASARSSKLTVANAIVPSREIACAPAAYGLTTPVTWGRRATRLSVAPTVARSAASVIVPVRARKTIWSASPACAGKRLYSRSTACWDPVPGSVKLLAFFFPTELETAKIPTAATIHPITTIRRCAIVQRAMFSTVAPSFSSGKSASRAFIYGLQLDVNTQCKISWCEVFLLNWR